MDDQLAFILLVQTYAIVKNLQNKRGSSLALQAVANALTVPISRIPKDENGTYEEAAIDLVDYQMQDTNEYSSLLYKRTRIDPPEWTGWK